MEYEEKMTEKMSDEDKKAYETYENKCRAESDVHTLKEAGEIKADSKRMKMAVHCAKSMMDSLKSIKGE